MSSTSTTQYYGLTQYVGTDKPDFADNNVAFRNVDAALHGVVQDAEGFATDITNLQTDVAAAQSDITTLQTDLDTAEAAIVTINNKDLAQDAEIARVDTNSKDMITAYNEASATSTHAYAIGDYFIYNNVLYKAIAAIAIGDTIVPDTNCTTTNVTSELIQLNSDIGNIFNAKYIHGERLSVDADQSIQSYTQKLTGVFNLDGTDYGDSNTTVDVLILRSNFVDGDYNNGLIIGLITSSNNGTLYGKRGKAIIRTEFQNTFTGWKSLT